MAEGMYRKITIEACVENIGEAIKAGQMGAGRIELCENLSVGGTTPSAGTLKVCKKYLTIPVFVMIRPRGGEFTYSPEELEVMEGDIRVMKDAGADGLVMGALTPDKKVDRDRLKKLLSLSDPLPVTFHKAIDEAGDILSELKALKELGVSRVLTSGGAATAMEGAETIQQMIAVADNKLRIIVAGKVTASNLAGHIRLFNTDEFHGRRILGEP